MAYTIYKHNMSNVVRENVSEEAALHFLRISAKLLHDKVIYGEPVRNTWLVASDTPIAEIERKPEKTGGLNIQNAFTLEEWERFKARWRKMQKAFGVIAE